MQAEQGSEAWHDQRAMKVTGSRIGAILGHSPWQKREDIMVEFIQAHQGLPREDKSNIAMQWGIDHEPIALRAFEDVSGDLVTLDGFVQHDEFDNVGMSPDGIANDRLLEVKCPYSKKIPLRVPEHYNDQVQLGMQVMNFDEAILYYWTPDDHRTFVVQRDDEWWKATLPVIDEFMAEFEERKDKELILEVNVTEEDAITLAERLSHINKTIKDYTEMANSVKKELVKYVDETVDTNIGLFRATHVTRRGSYDYAKYVKDNGIGIPSDYKKKDTTYIKWSER